MNEGHSSFVVFEVIKKLMKEYDIPFRVAKEMASSRTIFTTHTPVPAGNDIFPLDLMDRYFAQYSQELGISRTDFLIMGSRDSNIPVNGFDMAVLALKVAGKKNGVSKLHGEVSKRLFSNIWPNTSLEEVPIDAARFFFNLREPNSHFDFDLELAAKQSSDNPVYYVQYAHARICSIIKRAKEQGAEITMPTDEELKLLSSSEERELITHLSMLTDEIIAAAKSYDPARITHYVIELATLFHKFYNAHRVVAENKALMNARLYLCTAVKSTIYNVLTMLKITAPESM
jgi:hypothetical protein